MEAYDKGLREIGRKILIENNITPNKLINQECTPITFEPISARINVNNEVILIGYLYQDRTDYKVRKEYKLNNLFSDYKKNNFKIGNMNNKFTEESLTYFFNKRNNIRKEYDTKITSISNKFFADNNLPFKVGDKVKFSKFTGSATGIIKYVTISNILDNALSREPEVMIAIDGYVGLMQRFPISKIKKV